MNCPLAKTTTSAMVTALSRLIVALCQIDSTASPREKAVRRLDVPRGWRRYGRAPVPSERAALKGTHRENAHAHPCHHLNRRGRAYLKEVQRMNSTRLPVAIRPARAWATSPAIAFPV